jgi:predicted MFS family arabinose efflux permease
MTTSSKTTLFTPAILLTSLAVGLYWISLYLYVPTLPVYAQSKTSNLALIGTVLAQYGLWQAIVRFPLGIASDWLGRRRPFVFLGFFLAGLGAWLMGSASSIQGVLVGRAVTGLAAASWVILVVAFSSLFPPKEAVRATALLSMVNSVSRMFATGITGELNNLGGYSLAFTLAAVSAGLAALVYLPVKEEPLERKSPSLQGTGKLISRRDVLLPSLLNALAQYAAWATAFGFVPILAKQFGASNIAQSLLVSLNLAIGIFGNLFTTTFVKRFGARRLVLAGFLATVGGILLLFLAQNLAWVFAATFFIGLGFGLSYPTLMGMSIEHVEGSQRSTAMGLHQAVYAIGMFAGPWLSGILAKSLGVQPMFGITAAGVLILALLGTRKLEYVLLMKSSFSRL